MHSDIFNYIDPVIFNIFGFDIKWYGLAYVFGIMLGYFILKKNAKIIPDCNLSSDFYDDLIFYMLVAMIVGGRLGHVLFYDFSYYIAKPIDILKTYEGGMSFHGGLLGCTFACYIACKKHKLKFFHLSDLLCTVAPIGLFFGRIANFINAELIGISTDLPWGVVFPGSDGIPRHPTQIYEALTEGVLLFIILNIVFRARFKWFYAKSKGNKLNFGMITSLFLILYSSMRFFIEYLKHPGKPLIECFFNLSVGQILCIFMFIIGVIILIYTFNCRKYLQHKKLG